MLFFLLSLLVFLFFCLGLSVGLRKGEKNAENKYIRNINDIINNTCIKCRERRGTVYY